MGRVRLEIKYREDRRARIATYWSRMTGLKKKARELSTLCGVDVLLASFSPEIQTAHIWPENNSSFGRVAERYRGTSGPIAEIPSPRVLSWPPPSLPSPSPQPPSRILEQIHSMTRIPEEVKERVSVLESVGDDEDICALLNLDMVMSFPSLTFEEQFSFDAHNI
ncbi:hypothetical protein KSP40_PGU011841 [Platanthera guangdongensis]|uniref:MADS-box domain-containing protein n=1 Tax=Platanthera guangdongensis TaxID=2320717 RepID=A0ABR2LNW8_9ASPA